MRITRARWRQSTHRATFLRVTTTADAVSALRRYQESAPWRLGDLAALADELLTIAGAPPERATSERSLRFYVTRGVLHPPYGRGAGSSWGYRHLVELLAARLAQQGGETLEQIASTRQRLSEPALERLVAEALGPGFFRPRLVREASVDAPALPIGSGWQRFDAGDGVELHLATSHPLLADPVRLNALLTQLAELTHPPQES